MCSVSFLPDEKVGFVLTSNRDESINRQATPPEIYSYRGQSVLFPKDANVNGSWIACTQDRAVCLLNGGHEKHQHKPPYKISRGVVLLDILCSENIHEFCKKYELIGIEPFTVIYVDRNGMDLFTLIWDGIFADLKRLDATLPHFWSSATLYDLEWRNTRKNWFDQFSKTLTSKVSAPNELMHFHLTGGTKNSEYDLVMSRNNGNLRTISITQITGKDRCRMRYIDLLSQKEYTVEC